MTNRNEPFGRLMNRQRPYTQWMMRAFVVALVTSFLSVSAYDTFAPLRAAVQRLITILMGQ